MAGERILIVDDEERIRKLIGAYLQRNGYQVAFAEDGLAGLRAVGELSPDLVLTDVNMPNMTGLELTRRLRSHHKTARIPIIMLSALKDSQDMLAGYAQGADDYIPKPFEMAVLAAKVEIILARAAAVPKQAAPEAGKVIVFMHGKGGVGTTTLAVNCAIALAVPPSRVNLLDLNLEFPATHVHLNLRPAATLAGLGDLGGQLDAETMPRFVSRHQSGVGLVLGCDAPELAELVTLPAIQQAVDALRLSSDYVLIDCPANFAERTLTALDTAAAVCLVSGVSVPSLKATLDCLQVLEKLRYPLEKQVLVLNRTTPLGVSIEQATSFFGRSPNAVIGYSDLFDHGTNSGRPLVISHPEYPGVREVRELAAQLAKAADGLA